MSSQPPPPTLEEIARAEAERALSAHRDLIPEADFAMLCAVMADELLANAASRRLLAQVRPAMEKDESGEVVIKTGQPRDMATAPAAKARKQ